MAYTPTKSKTLKESSYANIRGALGSKETYTVTGSGGTATVTPKESGSYPEVTTERERLIIEAAGSGSELTEQQKTELAEKNIVVTTIPILEEGTTAQGTTVKKQETSNYANIQRIIAEKIIAEKANEPIQKVSIAISKADVERTNKQFKEAGISNAAEMFSAVKKGELTEKEGTYTITKTKTITPPIPLPPKFPSKEYFLEQVKEGKADIKIWEDMFNKGELAETATTKGAEGIGKIAYGSAGFVATELINPFIYLFKEPPYKEGIPEKELEISKQKTAVYQAELTAAQLQLGGYGLFISKPTISSARAEPILIKIEREPYEFVKPFIDKRAIQRAEAPSIIKGIAPQDNTFGLIKPSELQSQLYPKTLVEERSILAPLQKDLPSYREVESVFNKIKYSEDIKKTSTTPEEVLRTFREENPITNQQTLPEATFTPPKPSKQPLQIEEATLEYKGRKVLIINKKGQANAGEIFSTFDPNVLNPFNKMSKNKKMPSKFDSLGSVINPSHPPEEITYIVAAVSPHFPKGIKPIEELRVNIYQLEGQKIIPINIMSAKIQQEQKQTLISKNQLAQAKTQIQAQNQIRVQARAQAQTQAQIQAQAQVQAQAQTQAQIQAQAQVQAQAQIQEQITTQEQIQEQITTQQNIFKTTKTTTQEPPPPPKEIMLIPPIPLKKPLKIKEKGMFTVEVRKKGVFQSIGIRSTEEEALNLAESRVKTTASASFRILEQGSPITELEAEEKIFYPSKKERGVFIQRREKRISTPGEKQEITYQGIMSNKFKSRNKKSKEVFGGKAAW